MSQWTVLKRTLTGRSFSVALTSLFLLSAFFWLFPEADLETSALFYRKGQGFFLSHDPGFQLVRRIGIDLSWAYGAVAIGLVVAGLILRAYRGELIRRAVFLIGVMVLGPGLLVNLVLKDHWGRARPRNVIDFGGTLPYSKVWEIVPYCKTNCSFVSGESAAAFALLATVFVVPERYRMKVAIPLLVPVSMISFDRVVFGGHFLSDTVLSWAIVLIVMLALHWLIIQGKGDPVFKFLQAWMASCTRMASRWREDP